MTSFLNPNFPVEDRHQRDTNNALYTAVNQLAQFVYWGAGAPTFTPTDPKGNATVALYLNLSGGAGTSIYGYDLTSWTAIA